MKVVYNPFTSEFQLINEGGTAPTSGDIVYTGNLTVRDADIPTKQYRFRTSGYELDTEGAGRDWYWSVWSGADFTGTQYNQMIMSASGGAVNFPRGVTTTGATRLGGVNFGAVRQSSDYVVGDGVSIVFMDCTAATREVKLPSGWQSGNLGRIVKVRRVDGSANTLKVNTNGGDIQIKNSGSVVPEVLISAYGSQEFVSNGNGMWFEM